MDNSVNKKDVTTSTEKKVTKRKTTPKKVEKPTSEIGNLVHLQEKGRVAKRLYRNPLNRTEIKTEDFNVSDFEVAVRYDKDGNKIKGGSISFIEKTYDYYVTNSRINQERGIKGETNVKPFPVNEFLRVGIHKFCEYLGDDDWTVDPKGLTASHIFVLMKNIDKKFIEERFGHRLIGRHGRLLLGKKKVTKITKILEEFKEIRIGNAFIAVDNILHIPDFDDSLTLEDL